LYGKNVNNLKLFVPAASFSRVYEECGESSVFILDIEGDKRNVLIKDVQLDMLKGFPIHADFYQVKMDEEIEAEVELVFTGESSAVKELGGILVKSVDAVTVKCFPRDLPPEIKVDVSPLKTFDDTISVSNLELPQNVEVLMDPETVIVSVSPPRSEEELAELEKTIEADASQVEVLKEKRKEEEEAAQEGSEISAK